MDDVIKPNAFINDDIALWEKEWCIDDDYDYKVEKYETYTNIPGYDPVTRKIFKTKEKSDLYPAKKK